MQPRSTTLPFPNAGAGRSGVSVSLVVWAVAVLSLTGLGVLIFELTGARDFSSPAIILIGYTPSLTALLITVCFFGVGGLRSLLGSMGTWRVGLQWYAVALIAPLALVLLAHGVSRLLGAEPPRALMVIPGVGSTVGPLIAGSLGEEIGWRGFAQPLLQRRFSVFWASILVGVLWATWHLWPAIAPHTPVHIAPLDVLQTYVRLISTAVIYGWIYNSTRGSLLLVMLAHAGHNIAVDLLPVTTQGASLIVAFLYLAAAITLVWLTRARLITRRNV